jgi:hypothetical protein
LSIRRLDPECSVRGVQPQLSCSHSGRQISPILRLLLPCVYRKIDPSVDRATFERMTDSSTLPVNDPAAALPLLNLQQQFSLRSSDSVCPQNMKGALDEVSVRDSELTCLEQRCIKPLCKFAQEDPSVTSKVSKRVRTAMLWHGISLRCSRLVRVPDLLATGSIASPNNCFCGRETIREWDLFPQIAKRMVQFSRIPK